MCALDSTSVFYINFVCGERLSGGDYIVTGVILCLKKIMSLPSHGLSSARGCSKEKVAPNLVVSNVKVVFALGKIFSLTRYLQFNIFLKRYHL